MELTKPPEIKECSHPKRVTKVVINDSFELRPGYVGKVGDIRFRCSENCGLFRSEVVSKRIWLENIDFEPNVKIVDIRGQDGGYVTEDMVSKDLQDGVVPIKKGGRPGLF